MIKEALQYIIGLQKEPFFKEVDGKIFTDTPLQKLSYNPKAETINMHTLTSLVGYINSNFDVMKNNLIIEVESPTRVKMYSALDDERKREYLVNVDARIPSFPFDTFMDQEKFCINLQSKFIGSDDRNLILKFAGTVETGTVAEYGDDGVTQKATVKTGIASKGEAIVPNPVALRPYRTFLEVEQPKSSFIFRMKQDKYDGIQCAIFEADGGYWKMEATEEIRNYLAVELSEYKNIIVIS